MKSLLLSHLHLHTHTHTHVIQSEVKYLEFIIT